MLQVRFQSVVGVESVHKLYLKEVIHCVHLNTVSPCCTILFFVKDGQHVEVPLGFSMAIATPQGTKRVTAFQNRLFAMSHSVIHMLMRDNNTTAMCLCPHSFAQTSSVIGAPIITRSVSNSPYASLTSSTEEVSHNSDENRLREYICDTWGDCQELRGEIKRVGKEAFYYDEAVQMPVKFDLYKEFATQTDCWCGQCPGYATTK